MSNSNEAKKRVSVDAIKRAIEKGKTWENVATMFEFANADEIRSFTENRCKKPVFREIDKRAKKNQK